MSGLEELIAFKNELEKKSRSNSTDQKTSIMLHEISRRLMYIINELENEKNDKV